MKKLLTILFLVCGLISEAQLKGTDTSDIIDRSNEWTVTNPYIASYANKRYARIGIVPSHYATSTLPGAPAQGAVFYNTDSVDKLALWTGSAYVYLGFNSASGDGGVTTMAAIGSSPNANGATISGVTLNLEPASASFGGVVTTTTQVFAGTKTFNGTVNFGTTGANANLSLKRTSDGAEVGVIGVSTNPFINTQTGTFDFQSGGTSRMRIGTTGVYVGSATTPTANMNVGAAITRANNGTGGIMSGFLATTYTDNSTAGSGTVTHTAANGIARATFAASNSSVTYTHASTWYIDNAPAAGTNVTITNAWALYVAAGKSFHAGEFNIGSATDAGAFTLQNTGGLFQSGAVKIDLGSDATGDTYYRDGSGNYVRRAIGSTGDIYTVSGGIPIWATPLTTAQGTYTPTLTNTANIDASVAHICSYIQVGSVVHVAGMVEIDATTTLTVTELGLTLPVAASFAEEFELAGTTVITNSSGNESGNIRADITNERATLRFFSTSVANQSWYFTFTYRLGGS